MNIHELNDMMIGYLETAIWSSTTGEEGTPIDQDYGIGDFAEETIRESISDLNDFMTRCKAEKADFEDMEDSTIGHNFWLNRVGHGAGFWDSGLRDGDKISDICKENRAETVYIGDDNKLGKQLPNQSCY